MAINTVFFSILSIFSLIFIEKDETFLPAKILVVMPNCRVYYEGKVTSFSRGHTSVLGWLPNDDFFLVSVKDNYKVESLNISSSILVFDAYGNFIDTLFVFKSNKGERIYDIKISPQNRLYFRIQKNSPHKDDKIIEFDIDSRRILRRMDLWDKENYTNASMDYCFSPDGRFFIYSTNRILSKEGNIIKFDLITLSSEVLIKNGIDPIWSPDNRFIAFMQDNKVMLYNVEKKENQVFFTPPLTEIIESIYWLPDGKTLYFTSWQIKTKGKFKIIRKGLLNVDNMQVKDLSAEDYKKTGEIFYWKK